MTQKILDAIANNLEQNIRDEDFDMGSWVKCAIGLSWDLPEVRKTGLFFMGHRRPYYWQGGTDPLSGVRALSAAFDLTTVEVVYLFCSCRYVMPTRNNVIKRLRNFSKGTI